MKPQIFFTTMPPGSLERDLVRHELRIFEFYADLSEVEFNNPRDKLYKVTIEEVPADAH